MQLALQRSQDVDRESLSRSLLSITDLTDHGRRADDSCVQFHHWSSGELEDGVSFVGGAYVALAPARMIFAVPMSVHIFVRLAGESVSGFDGAPVHESADAEIQVWRVPQGGLKLVEQPPSRPTRFVSYMISSEAFERLTGEPATRETAPWLAAHPLPPGVREAMRAYFEANLHETPRALYRRGKALEILGLLGHAMRRDNTSDAPPAFPLRSADVERIRAAAALMSANPAAPWSLHGLARDVGVNVNKLKGGFRSIYGVSVFSYLRDCRLEMALEFLKSTDLGVAQIAYRVGFASPSHFTQLFHARFAAPPLAYRRAHGQAANNDGPARLSA